GRPDHAVATTFGTESKGVGNVTTADEVLLPSVGVILTIPVRTFGIAATCVERADSADVSAFDWIAALSVTKSSPPRLVSTAASMSSSSQRATLSYTASCRSLRRSSSPSVAWSIIHTPDSGEVTDAIPETPRGPVPISYGSDSVPSEYSHVTV